MKEKPKREIIILVLLVLISSTSIVIADSYALYCLGPGEQIDLGATCNPAMDPRSGPTNLCIHILDNGKECPAPINTCNSLSLGCSTSNSTHVDRTPPNITINSPSIGSIHTSRSVLLDVDAGEKADIYYFDNFDERRKWTQICNNCFRYSNKRSFNEGLNNITVRAKDNNANFAYESTIFYVDSNDPKIRKVEPNRGFASGTFYSEIDEANPSSLNLIYGTPDDMRNQNLDLYTDCIQNERDKEKYHCRASVPLNDFDGQEILFYFNITDILGNTATNKLITAPVDTTFPVIDSLYYGNYKNSGTFVINITEANLEAVEYQDLLDSKPRWKKLCTKLKEGICVKKVNFKDGQHDVVIMVTDEAGNSVSQNISFFTDNKKPKISKSEPRNGFASGYFMAEFIEANPISLILTYGNNIIGYEHKSIDLINECVKNRNKDQCSTNVNIDLYDGQEIEFYFNLTDIVNQSIMSKINTLDVDTTFPVIKSINHNVDGTRVNIFLNITELNFEEALYTITSDSRPRQRTLCTRLNNGFCEKRITLREGQHNLSITVYDEAGNAVGQEYQIIV